MKYRALLMGNNKTMIEDIFKYSDGEFEFQSTSNQFDDLKCHLKYFKPHILLYCMHNEAYDTMQKLVNLKHETVRGKTFFAAVASAEDCAELRRISVNVVDLEIEKPVTVSQITGKLIRYLERNLGDVPESTEMGMEMEMKMEMGIQQEVPQEHKVVKDTVSEDALLLQDLDEMFSVSPPKVQPKKTQTIQPENSGQTHQPSETPVQTDTQQMKSRRKHILVVDDDFRMLKLIKRYLEDSYDVATAVNGKVALKFLQSKMTNLILLDYEMPGENGPVVLEKLRANPATRNIPVVFLTGINDTKKIMQVLALKPQGYLLKPIEHDKLISEIQKVIG